MENYENLFQTDKFLKFITVGRLSGEKGHKYLIEAFTKVLKEIPNSKLFIIGEGKTRPQIEKMIQVMEYVDKRFSLDLMMVDTDNRYYKRLNKIADKVDSVNIIPPVPFNAIIQETNKYDIGFFAYLFGKLKHQRTDIRFPLS